MARIKLKWEPEGEFPLPLCPECSEPLDLKEVRGLKTTGDSQDSWCERCNTSFKIGVIVERHFKTWTDNGAK